MDWEWLDLALRIKNNRPPSGQRELANHVLEVMHGFTLHQTKGLYRVESTCQRLRRYRWMVV